MWLHSRVGKMCASCAVCICLRSLIAYAFWFCFHFIFGGIHVGLSPPDCNALQSVCSLPIIRPDRSWALGSAFLFFLFLFFSCSPSVLSHQQNNCSPFYPPIHSTANAMHCETKLLYCYIKNWCADCSRFFFFSPLFISFILFSSTFLFRLLFNSIYNLNGMRVY